MEQGRGSQGGMDGDMTRWNYMMLALNLLLSLGIMYFAMFAMIWSWAEFIQNINFFYMALIMWAPMAIVMILTMRMMFTNRRLNAILYAAFALVLLLSSWAMRDQGLVGDKQFARSMIPHHSGAILMCREAALEDAELRDLCYGPKGIVATQIEEIRQMKRILHRLD